MNYRFLKDIHNLAGNRYVDDAMKISAKGLIFVAFLILAVLVLMRLRERAVRDVVWTGAALVLSFALGLAAAAAHSEARPFTTHPDFHPLVTHAPGQSFPSDHSTAAFAIAFAVLAFLSVRVGIVLLAVAALIGFSRIYEGVHYPGDILGSIVVAAVGVGVVMLVRRARSDPQPA